MATTKFGRFARGLVQYVFLPTRADTKKVFSVLSLVLVVAVCVLIIVPTIPPVSRYVIEGWSAEDRTYYAEQKDVLKAWIACGSLTLEVVIALAIGGSVFGERITKMFQEAVSRYQSAVENLLANEAVRLEEETDALAEELTKRLEEVGKKGLLSGVWEICELAGVANRLRVQLLRDVPSFYRRYLLGMLCSNFPGGFYGVVAFGSFVVLALLKSGQAILDSPYLAAG